MEHKPVEMPAALRVPQIELLLFDDNMDGYNLKIELAHFELQPPQRGTAPDEVLTGHAHLHINGEKVGRLYSTDVHLPARLFREGVNQISVSLNNHMHSTWLSENRELVATLFIEPGKQPLIKHRFSASPLKAK